MPRDLTGGWNGVALWGLPAVALVLSASAGDQRWWIWSPALTIMGVACLINVVRCGRLHCYLTGPAFLVGALLSTLRGLHVVFISWNWISVLIVVAWPAGLILERIFGPYVRRSDA